MFGVRTRCPVALMTSEAACNHARVAALCEASAWFGRGRRSFRLFAQPLVPVLDAATGRWLLSSPGCLALKPGGHGAVWKLAADGGVLGWMERRGARAALVRQISNPLAGADLTQLALAGAGLDGPGRDWGFATCPRTPGAAEGANVLREREPPPGASPPGARLFNVSCVEYTEFRGGGAGGGAGVDASALPANTNVLFVRLSAVRAALASGPAGSLPGLLVNLSKPGPGDGPGGAPASRAGRLECSMQGIVDARPDARHDRPPPPPPPGAAAAQPLPPFWATLSSFIVSTERRRVTSSAKRTRSGPHDDVLAQTPEGAFLDLLRNAGDVLRLGGGAHPPLPATSAAFAAARCCPPFLFCHHPGLGPPWHVAAQKVARATLRPGAELELELCEALVDGLTVDGSLRVVATDPMGPMEADEADGDDGDGGGEVGGGAASAAAAGSCPCPPPPPRPAGPGSAVTYCAARCGRARLVGVAVANAGVDWSHPATRAWSGDLVRREGVLVTLRGRAELDAEGVTLAGGHSFDVPDGCVLRLRPDASPGAPPGAFTAQLAPLGPGPSWWWHHEMEPGGRVALTVCRAGKGEPR